MNEIKELFNINFSYVLISVFVILTGVKAIVSILEWVVNKLGLETKWIKRRNEEHELLMRTVNKLEKLQNDYLALVKQSTNSYQETKNDLSAFITKMNNRIDDLKIKQDKITNCVNKIEESSKVRNDAIIEEMCDRIGQKTKYYINSLHGIPEDEYDDFVRLFNTYENIGGNHGAKKRYEYCINHLDILPVKKETVIENE